MPEASGLENKLPVFTTPHQQITFNYDDPSTYKQILAIINPYDFQVKFKILVCSADCTKYTVSVPQGKIKPHHSVDVVLQHVAVTPSNIGISDKVRVQLFSTGQVRASGKKDLPVILLDNARLSGASVEGERFQQFEANPASLEHLRQQPLTATLVQENKSSNKVFYGIVLVAGAIILAMPREGDTSEYFPNFLPRPTGEVKLMLAFFLGIICVLFLQS